MKADVPIYTPVVRATGVRIRIENPVYEDGFHHGRGLGNKGVLSDPDTGKRYFISGKPCDIPNCQCDAWADELSESPN